MSKTVLVVDDDEGLQATLEAILELEGYTAIIAGDGLAALEILSQDLPAVIVLDLVMPRMDGFAFAQEVERRGLRAAAPILAITADGRAQEKARQLGADDYLAKPFDMDDLLRKIRHLTGH